jgi:hypothetical protein
MTILTGFEIAVDVDKVLRGMGGDPGQLRARRPVLVELAEWAIIEGIALIEAKAAFSQYEVKSLSHEKLSLGDNKLLSGPLVIEHLAPSKQVTAVVCTLGESLEAVISELLMEDPVRGLAMDGLANASIEVLANKICNLFEIQAQESGLATTIPLSPGMLGWPVEVGQRQIFSLVDAGRIGVSLEESSMMRPKKSLSMVVGLGEVYSTKSRTCDYCSLKDTCRYQDHYA